MKYRKEPARDTGRDRLGVKQTQSLTNIWGVCTVNPAQVRGGAQHRRTETLKGLRATEVGVGCQSRKKIN